MIVMSLNLCSWGDGENSIPNRQPRMLKILKTYAPDIFGIQEGTEEWMAYLKNNLPEYTSYGIGRDENGTGEASAVFFKKDLFRLLDQDMFWLSETPDRLSQGWDGRCRRVCTKVILQRESDGFKFAFFNTHLDHIGPVAQKKGAELINARAIQYAETMPVILTGDFNVSFGSEAYNSITLLDTRKIAESTESGGTWHGYSDTLDMSKELPIDHCFVSKDIPVKRYQTIKDKVDGKFVSDHYPILVELW